MAIRVSSWGKWLVRYGAALAAAVAGLLVRWALEAWVGPGLPTYLTFYPVVMAVALLWGLGPGLVTTVAAAALADYWVIVPRGFGIAKPVDAVGLAFFLGVCVGMSFVVEYGRRARLKAAAYDREQALRETRRQNQFLAAIIERSSQPFAIGYPDGRLGLFNPAFEQLTGYTAEELRSSDWSNTLTPPEWRQAERVKLEELTRTGQPVRYEKEYLRKDGRRVPIELLVHLARDAKGQPEYYYSFLADITERKQAEVNLRRLNAGLEQRVAEQTAQIRRANEELEQRVSERTAELQAAKEAVQASRGTTLSLLEDALEARAATEKANADLQGAVDSLEASRKAAVNLMEDSLRARNHAETVSAELRENQDRLLKLNRVLKALKDSSLAMIHSTSETQYLEEVCRFVVEDCGHAMVWVGFAEDDAAKTVRPAAYSGFEEGYLESMRISWADTDRGHGPTGTAVRTGQTCVCKDMLADPAFAPWREEALKRGYASSMATPLLEPGRDASPSLPSPRALGALTIYSKEPDAFSEDELKLLTQLAGDISYCIRALRARAQGERAERRTELLAETASRLLGTDAPQSVIEDLCRKVLAFLDCQAFFNYLLMDDHSGRLHLNACAGIPDEEAKRIEWLDSGIAVCGCAARDSCRIVAEDIQHTQDPRTELVKALGIQAYACHPLLVQGRVLGTLSFGTRTRTHFQEEDLSLMQAVTDLVAVAVERRRVQAALRQANEELEQRVAHRTEELHQAARYSRSLLEASLDPLVTISPQGEVTDVNRATEEATGLSRAQLIGTDFSSYFTQPAKAEAGYQRVLAEGLVRDYPLTIRHASGRTTDVLYHATVYRDEAGKVQGVFAAARDITERKQAERRRELTTALLALFAHEASARDYLHSVVEAIRQWSGCQALGIRVADDGGEIPFVSWTGFDPQFIELESGLSLHRDNCCCIRAITQTFESPDTPLLTPGGSFRADDSISFVNNLQPEQRARYRGNCMKFGFASLAIVPIRYREHVVGAVHMADHRPGRFPPGLIEFLESMAPLIGEAMHRFQTEAELARHRDQLEVLVRQRTQELTSANARLEKTAQDLKRSNLDLEQFAYVASHDLQEPLRAVGGYIQLVERKMPKPLAPKIQDYLTGAFDGALRMERLINDLLDYSRVGSRGRALVPTELDGVLDQALGNLKPRITSAHAVITREPLPKVPVDSTQLMQVFQNLIGNALKFHGEMPPAVHVGATQEDGRWIISVRDNGIGIDPDYFGKLFNLFQRLHNRKEYPGTGIGLAVCKRIVERHGGTIWVESQPGKGSTFYFSIPKP